MWAAVISVLIGLWMMAAPEYYAFGHIEGKNFFIVGPLVVTAAVIAIWEVNRSARYFNFVAGIWMMISPLLLPYETQLGITGSVVSGVLLIILSLIKGKITRRYGGGWEPLFKEDYSFFKDKVVVITGATGGVGRVAAWHFAKVGARVVLIARDKEQLENTAKEVEVYGGLAMAIPIDVADAQKLEEAVERIEHEWGPIEVWVNNAMNSVFAPFKEITPKEFARVTEVTYLGTVYGTMAVLNRMLSRNRGSIVFVGSALAYRGIPLQSAYCGAKHGIQGFYDSLRTELMHEKSNVKTCMVQLPAMNTTQFGWVLNKLPNKTRPMGKVYQPEVAARAILFAALHNRREVLVGFPTYKAIVGNKIAPWYADWVLARQGFKGQQTDVPVDQDRKDNLWKPVGEDRGAYGAFEDIATGKSFTLWISMHRNWVRAAVFIAVVVILTLLYFY
ncbi:SDR family oxidoreductase [Chryseolinea sp. H1M3-3]|uniref:SDR family oxidoreductase n=1 Tax=Chryseolinea sp. H1M3-3 TaxID=3034144 RepID=UPI0023EC528B|nr:SDR family oxidoreductase [Chryseolinea sp. H1M3-3]